MTAYVCMSKYLSVLTCVSSVARHHYLAHDDLSYSLRQVSRTFRHVLDMTRFLLFAGQ